MKNKIAWIGLDVHKNSITLALVETGSGNEKFVQKLPNNPNQLIKLLRKPNGRHQAGKIFSFGTADGY